MRITIITQDDPYYLAENIEYLIQHLPCHSKIVSCVVLDVSPFGKKESFANKALKTLQTFGMRFFIRYSIKLILSKFDNTKSIKRVLQKHGIPVIKLETSINSSHSLAIINEYRPDLLLSIAGNQIFSKALIKSAVMGCLNLHTALLPKYRGLMPSFWVLKNNERFTGVSLFFVDEGIDSGPILVQKKIEIGEISLEQLISATKRMGMDAIIEGVNLLQNGQYDIIPNDKSQMSYYHFPTRADVKEFIRAGKHFY